jgi:hypothetical protein
MLEALPAVWAAQEDAGECRHDALPDRRQARGWWRAGLGGVRGRPGPCTLLAEGGAWAMGLYRPYEVVTDVGSQG